MRRYRLFLLPVLLTAILPAWSGTIDLEVTVTVNKHELDVELEILVANRGDDGAYRVEPSARVGDLAYKFDPAEVAPGKQRTFRNRQSISAIAGMKPGEYPVPVMVAYFDGEGAQFHAPAYGILRTADTEFRPQLALQCDPVTLADHATANLHIQAAGLPDDAGVTVTPHTSPIVTVTPEIALISPASNQAETVRFDLRNSSGAAGLVLPLIFFAEIESNEAHATRVYDVEIIFDNPELPVDSKTGKCYVKNYGAILIMTVILSAVASTGWVLLRSRRKGSARDLTQMKYTHETGDGKNRCNR